MHEKYESRGPASRVVVVTVSDTRSTRTDQSGPVIVAALTEAGMTVVRHSIVRDEIDDIRAIVRTVASAQEADAVVLTGGTGIGPRDHTFEALAPLYSLTLDGFGEAFRRLSFDQIGPRALMSRASAGVVGDLVVFSLPGSLHAARLGVDALIVPMLGHAVEQRQGRCSH